MLGTGVVLKKSKCSIPDSKPFCKLRPLAEEVFPYYSVLWQVWPMLHAGFSRKTLITKTGKEGLRCL